MEYKGWFVVKCHKCNTNLKYEDYFCPECGIRVKIKKAPKKLQFNLNQKNIIVIAFVIIIITIIVNLQTEKTQKFEEKSIEEVIEKKPVIAKKPIEFDLGDNPHSEFDLSNYPYFFFENNKFNGILVVGDKAPAEDVIGISDIAVSLQSTYGGTPRLDVGATKLASEVLTVSDTNTILIGNACVNTLIFEILGKPKDCKSGLEPGTGKIDLYNDKYGNVHLVVSGYNPADRRNAAMVLANYKDYGLSGNSIGAKKIGSTLVAEMGEEVEEEVEEEEVEEEEVEEEEVEEEEAIVDINFELVDITNSYGPAGFVGHILRYNYNPKFKSSKNIFNIYIDGKLQSIPYDNGAKSDIQREDSSWTCGPSSSWTKNAKSCTHSIAWYCKYPNCFGDKFSGLHQIKSIITLTNGNKYEYTKKIDFNNLKALK